MEQLELLVDSAINKKNKFRQLNVMRYMGNKQKLLHFIIPRIMDETKEGDLIFDLMAGTHCIGYALKERNQIFANDILVSSYTIGKALIENNYARANSFEIERELRNFYYDNQANKYYNFFETYYADTYFSKQQCIDIDSIRYAIERIPADEYKKAIYLTALIYTMCYAQSTPGHFAQYMPKEHPRIKKLQEISIWNVFIEKLYDFNNIHLSNYRNKVYNFDYKIFFDKHPYRKIISKVKLFYLDPPYTSEQYSRFYHILETIVRYDYPKLAYKGLYRPDRFKSRFCYHSKVIGEFEYLLKNISILKTAKVLISYSNTGLISKDKLLGLCKKYFKTVEGEEQEYPHSTQGKGLSNGVFEFLVICRN